MQNSLNKEELDPEKAQRIGNLIAKYLRGELTIAMHNELENWVAASDTHMKVFEELTDEKALQEGVDWVTATKKGKMLRKLKKQLHFNRPRFRFGFFQYAV